MIPLSIPFSTLQTCVRSAYEELYLEGQRNTALEGLYSAVMNN